MAILDSKLRQILAPCLATALMLGNGVVLAQSTSIPASLEGTYSLTFESAQTGAPLTNGTTVDLVIAAGGTVANTLGELTGQPVTPIEELVVEVPDGDYKLTFEYLKK